MLANIPHFWETMNKKRRVRSSLFRSSFIASLAAIPPALAHRSDWRSSTREAASRVRFTVKHEDAAGEARGDEWPDGFAMK